VNAVLLLVVFALPVVAGCVAGVWSWWRPRVHLARAFARGHAENIARLPAPVEPLPDLTRKAAA
jgi:hypothetical protein